MIDSNQKTQRAEITEGHLCCAILQVYGLSVEMLGSVASFEGDFSTKIRENRCFFCQYGSKVDTLSILYITTFIDSFLQNR